MRVPFVDLRAQYQAIRGEVDAAIRSVLEETAFVGGRFVREFETAFADYLGCRACIGVGNGTDALTIVLRCLGVGPGDEVIVPVNTFIASAEAVSSCGATVVLCDVDSTTETLDPGRVRERLSGRTRALLPVHLYGRVAAMDELGAIARDHGLLVVEDAAQAHGARLGGRAAGTMGVAGCFSFYPGKNLGAYGDAGAVVTDDERLAERVRMHANHGRLAKYEHEFEGVNSRLDGLQAAVLSVKLAHLAQWTDQRYHHARLYDRLLAGLAEVQRPALPQPGEHVFHLYVVRVPRRDELRAFLTERGVGSGVHYPRTLATLPAYQHLGYRPEEFPVASADQDRVLSLPMYPELDEEQIGYVVDCLRAFYGG